MCVLATLSLSVFHNSLISVQPPSRILLPCRHSVALNHPKVYKKMWVSWETWILPQLSLSLFFLPISVFLSFSLLSLPLFSFLTPFPICFSFSLLHHLSLSLLLSSPLLSALLLQEVPAVMMKVLNIRGNPCRVSVVFSHLSFCARALVL